MKQISLLIISIILFFENLSSQELQKVGYYGDLYRGINSEYHIQNINKLFSLSNIDTINYCLVKFIGNSELAYLNYNSNVISATLEVSEDVIISFEKKTTLSAVFNKTKVFVIFYFQSIDRKKTTYFFYRYG